MICDCYVVGIKFGEELCVLCGGIIACCVFFIGGKIDWSCIDKEIIRCFVGV